MSNQTLPSYDKLLREFNALAKQADELTRRANDIKEEMDVIRPKGTKRYEIWCCMDGVFWNLWGATSQREAADERLAKLRKENPATEYEIRESTR